MSSRLLLTVVLILLISVLGRFRNPQAPGAEAASSGPAGVNAAAAMQPRLWFPSVALPGALAAASGRPDGVLDYNITQRLHVTTPVVYPQTPPVGGNHWPVWVNCGFYRQPVRTEEGVHSMEHGAVWITYAPNLPGAAVNQLHDIVRQERKTIGSPFAGLPAPIVVSAWDHQLYLNSAGDARLVQFIHFFREGPESGEPFGECTGGHGTPLP